MNNILTRFTTLSFIWQYTISMVLSLLLFMPLIGNGFVNDDYIVLKKVCIEGQLNTEGFFRPLSDITLYMNYYLHGLHPAGYYIFNIIMHALSALLLFHFCLRLRFTSDTHKQQLMAALSALLFLVYPFHSESIVWILGRASLLGNTFAMLALLIMVGNARELVKISGICICYFIALSGYETVAVLPAMVFVWLLFSNAPFKRHVLWLSALAITLVLHMLVRVLVSGVLAGDYGGGFFHVSFLGILENIAKVTGRLILPPMVSNLNLAVSFVVVMTLAVWLLLRLWKKIKGDRPAAYVFGQTVIFLFLALLVPYFFGISSHTSESDRFLHFPSFFFCMLLAFATIHFLFRRRALPIAVVCLIGYFTIYLQLTISNWRKASSAVHVLLSAVQNHHHKGKLHIVNLPGEIDGAFVFRIGFPEALAVCGLPHDSVQVINQVKRDSLIPLPATLVPRQEKQGIFIPPNVLVTRNGNGSGNYTGNGGTFVLFCRKEDKVIYWNKNEWVMY